MEQLRDVYDRPASKYQIRIVLGALFATVVADGVITEFLVLNGLAIESNPLLQLWVGRDAFLLLKLVGGLLAAVCLWSVYQKHPRLAVGFSSLLLAAYTFIIVWNLHILW